MKKTANKNTSHTRQPTPVRSAIRSIRVILPRIRTRVLSKVSLRSVRFEVSRISSPMAIVICKKKKKKSTKENDGPRMTTGRTYILQHLHFGSNSLHLGIVLRLQRRKNSVGVLPPTLMSIYVTNLACHQPTYLLFGVALRNPPEALPLIDPLSCPAPEYPP